MTFDHPWALLALLLPLAWAAWEWRAAARRVALALKAAALACILLALAGPRMVIYQHKVAVAVLADTSASLSPQDLTRASALANAVERSSGRNWMRLIPFARATRAVSPEEKTAGGWHLRGTGGAAGHGTNLENAIGESLTALPASMLPRLLLLSDGHENLGSVSRAIWQARQLGVPIDTVALPGRPTPGLRLDGIALPGQVFSGERFPLDIAVEARGEAHATVELAAEGKTIGTSAVDLAAGLNRLRLQARINAVGAVSLSGRIAAGELGEARFEDSVTLRGPRALVVSRDPPESEAHLLRVLEANQFEAVRAPAGVPARLEDFQLVVLNNWDMESIPAAAKASLEEYVKQGGGLLWIAGERNIYVDRKGKPEDALERTLPARLAPPRSPEGTAVVLIVDKSSSMEGRKIELARLAAIGVVENLRPVDSVGVLIFDNSFQWAVPIRKAADRAAKIGRAHV